MTDQIGLPSAFVHPVLAQALGGETAPIPTTQAPGTTGAPGGQAQGTAGNSVFFFAIILMFGMFLMMSMSGRKEKKKRAAMLSELGKRDKVRTAGGIIGTIVEMKGDEVLIETDKSSHTRLWLAKGSVSTVLNSSSSLNKSDSAADDLETISA
jgi:preprotein translocase subunit YajC